MLFSPDFEERMKFWNGLVPLRPMVSGLGGYVVGGWDRSEAGTLYAAYQGIQYGRVVERFQEASLVEDYPRVLYAEEEGPYCPQERTLLRRCRVRFGKSLKLSGWCNFHSSQRSTLRVRIHTTNGNLAQIAGKYVHCF